MNFSLTNPSVPDPPRPQAARELPELQRQSRDYRQAWEGAGLPGRLLPLAGKNHYTIMEELAAPDGALTAALRSFLAASA